MLTRIYIQNFAIISQLELALDKGLIALTGETGAGKSIILGAINLLLGARADSNSLFNKNEKCIIEANFNSISKNIKTFLIANDIDNQDTEIIIRREIQSNGRSRAFVNDTPVTLNILENLGELLIDLHRQFDTLEVKDSDFQLEVLDTIASNQNLVLEYQKSFKNWKNAIDVLNKLKDEQEVLRKEKDYNQFLLNELEKINLKENEIENSEEQLAILSNAEELKATLTNVNLILQNGENPLVVDMKNCINQLNTQSKNLKKIQPLIDRLNSNLIELKDIVAELESIEETIDVDQEKLNYVLDKFNEGTRLLKKHNVNTTNELLEIQHSLIEKLNKISNADLQIEEATEKVNIAYQIVLEIANKLTKTRTKAALQAQQQVNNLLPKVGMPSANLKIEIQNIPCGINGVDKILFLFDANKTNKYLPIAKAASGGELSRLMLCIKSLLAKANNTSTLVFDEIDTGISGEVAKQVGIILKELAINHQIITVTHLPQIAAKALHHLFVYKSAEKDGTIKTKVKLLSEQERISHIAEMLSGTAPTATALQTAKELMEN